MANIKTTFTKEEVDEFINNLQNSIGNEKKVKELLHVRSLPILMAYLKEIGMPDDSLSKAGGVEATRIRMIEILTSPKYKNCVVSDTGIEYDFNYNKEYYRREKLGLDDIGNFRLSKDKYFKSMGGFFNKLVIMNDMENAYDPRIEIYEWGGARDIDYRMGVLGLKSKSKIINGIPYVEMKKYLIDGSVAHQKVIDTGLPFFSGNQDSTFEDNYEMYTALFPKTKIWYDSYFWCDYKNEDKRTVKEKSDDIERAVTLERLYNINLEIFGLKSNVMKGITNYKTYRENIFVIIGLLQEYKCENEEEREVVSLLMQKAQELAARKTEFDDKEKMEDVKAELSVKEEIKKYGDLDLDTLHKELSGREEKKERLSEIEECISTINEEYQRFFDEAQRLFDNRSGVRRKTSDIENIDTRSRLEKIKKAIIAKRDYYCGLVDSIYYLIMDLSDLRAMSITDDWCDKVDELMEKHGLRNQKNIDMERLYNRIRSSSTANMRLDYNCQMSEEEALDYELMLCESLLSRIECATFDFEDWKKELKRLKGVFLKVRADEIEKGKIRLSEREYDD